MLRSSSTSHWCIWLLAGALCACGQTPRGRAAKRPGPIDLGIKTTRGGWLEVADLRGKPTILFVFATFDDESQAQLRPLQYLAESRPDVYIVGVAAQPDAEELVRAWAYALEPTFVVGFDPSHTVETGTSALGQIESVPMLIGIDAKGFERKRVEGYQNPKAIDALLKSLR